MAQVFPLPDTFERGTEVAQVGRIRGYHGLLPNDTDFQPGRIHNGYGQGAAAARITGPSATPGTPIIQVRTEEFPANVRVTMSARKVAETGVVEDTQMQQHGVVARLTAALVQSSSGVAPDEITWFADASCYSFEARQVSAGVFRLFLVRYALGTENILAQTADLSGNVPEWSKSHQMVLEVETNGSGDVELTGYVGGVSISALGLSSTKTAFGIPGGSGEGAGIKHAESAASLAKVGLAFGPGSGSVAKKPGTSPTVQAGRIKEPGTIKGGPLDDVEPIVSATDSSIDKITTGGRCGFMLDDEQEVGFNKYVSLCEYFEVYGLNTNSVLFRDEFVRAAPGALGTVVDLHGTQGLDMSSDYGTDAGSASAPFVLTSDGANDAAVQTGKVELGKCVDLPGDGTNTGIFLNTPSESFIPPAPPSQLEVSIAVWAEIDTLQDGDHFYQTGYEDERDVLGFGMIDAGGGDAQIEVRFGTGVAGAPNTQTTASFPASDYLGTATCFLLTYKARAFANLNGECKVYAGRGGLATLLGTFVIPSSAEPGWSMVDNLIDGRHSVGWRRESTFPSGANAYLDGRIDMVSVFYNVLDAEDVNEVCSEIVQKARLLELGCIMGVDFDNETLDGGFYKWDPWEPPTPPASNSGRWLVRVNAGLPDGLVSQAADSVLEIASQRAVDSETAQAFSATFELPTSFARAGILLRNTGGADPSDGYRVLCGAGNPVAIEIQRVVGGNPRTIARTDPSELTTLALVTPFKLQAGVANADSTDPGSGALFEVLVDDVLISLAPVANVTDVSQDNQGRIIDAASDRIASGPVGGLAVVATFGNPVTLDTFDTEDPPDGPGPGGAPPIALPSIASKKFGSLNDVLTPDWQVRRVEGGGAQQQYRSEDGRPLSAALSTWNGRVFELQTRSIDTVGTALQDFRDFFDEHGGRAFPFDFDPAAFSEFDPPGVFRFTRDRLSDTERPNVGVFSITIEEVPG